MGKRFLHNRAAVVTVAFVLLIALIGILAFWGSMSKMSSLPMCSSNGRGMPA